MKNKIKSGLPAILILWALGTLLQSCSKSSDPFSGEITQTVNNESIQDSQQDEVDDIASGQLKVADSPGARMAVVHDDRVKGANISFSTDTTGGKMHGSITIDFGKDSTNATNPNGYQDPRGNIRKGRILIGWQGERWYKFGSSLTITLDNYSINGVVISGTRALSNVTTIPSQPTWTIVSTMTSTWPDNTTATRSVTKTRLWNIADGTIRVTQTVDDPEAASGINRHGTPYQVQITTALVYSSTCLLTNKVYLPISGVKVITIDTSKSITIDFGAGTCDKTFTITFDGKSATLNARNDSSSD